MTFRRGVVLVVLAAALALPACTQDDDIGAFDTHALVDALRGAGLTVARQGPLEQPFFSVPGTSLSVAGEGVQAFEYRSASAAEAEARRVSPDGGTIGNTAVSWIGPPHFHRRDRLIALYVGDAAAVKAALATVMGPQFAGR